MTTSLDRITHVTVTRATRTASRRSFASLCIAAYHMVFLDRVRSYSDPADMLTDGFTSDHPAYLAAVAALAQNPRVRQVKIGRRAGAPTQTITLTVTAVEEGWVYSITIGGETAEYTTLVGDVDADVGAGLAAAINGLAVAVTATDNLDGTVTVEADNAGDWFAYTAPDARLQLSDDTAEPATTLAADLAAIQAEDADWYGLIVADAQSAAQIAAIATWAETQRVIYFAHTIDTAVELAPTTDIHSTLKTAQRLRTLPCYNRLGHGAFFDAAAMEAFRTTQDRRTSSSRRCRGRRPTRSRIP